MARITFTATRSTVVGPKHTTHTVTVRDADGNTTDTRKSRTMEYVEVLVSIASGKIVAASQKSGGTPQRVGDIKVVRVPVTSVMDTPAEEPVAEVIDAKAALADAIAKVPARKLTLTAADIAREADIDPYRFRVYLRANGIARTVPAMRKAAKKFAAS